MQQSTHTMASSSSVPFSKSPSLLYLHVCMSWRREKNATAHRQRTRHAQSQTSEGSSSRATTTTTTTTTRRGTTQQRAGGVRHVRTDAQHVLAPNTRPASSATTGGLGAANTSAVVVVRARACVIVVCECVSVCVLLELYSHASTAPPTLVVRRQTAHDCVVHGESLVTSQPTHDWTIRRCDGCGCVALETSMYISTDCAWITSTALMAEMTWLIVSSCERASGRAKREADERERPHTHVEYHRARLMQGCREPTSALTNERQRRRRRRRRQRRQRQDDDHDDDDTGDAAAAAVAAAAAAAAAGRRRRRRRRQRACVKR
jgi:hypothetical protein